MIEKKTFRVNVPEELEGDNVIERYVRVYVGDKVDCVKTLPPAIGGTVTLSVQNTPNHVRLEFGYREAGKSRAWLSPQPLPDMLVISDKPASPKLSLPTTTTTTTTTTTAAPEAVTPVESPSGPVTEPYSPGVNGSPIHGPDEDELD